ncbi:MAG TPA: tetratricopeptide repeat protein [Sandaracinaceae bacterium LLY-WYZ-13_1]|nr:tetratricopeptide repeat protein [Sandaracinaceae bacterium LLY-WYZ-13_1]
MTDGRSQQGEEPREDESDLFSVKSYSSGTSIPVIEKVPETKEEIRRRLVLRITWALVAVVVAGIAIWVGLYLSHLSEVEEAVITAGTDGRVSSIREALALMEGDDDAASRATKLRLRAMLLLAGEDEDREAIAAGLDALPEGDEDVARERGIARTYLALAGGDLSAAMEHASEVVAQGDFAAEAARSRALAARSVGNVDQALQAAEIAVEQRPESPRHVALFAELTARAGDPEAALARLDDLPTDRRSPDTRIARARIMDRAGAAIDQVAEHAEAVLEAPDATFHEKAWARLLLARAAAAAGDRVVAREHLDTASEVAPPGDELFTLGLTEAALRIGAVHLAQQVAEGLPSPLSVDAGRRAQLSAELALAQHDLRAAESALEHAPEGARTALARARLLEARGAHDRARALYREAAGEPGYRVPATTYLASMELARDRAEEAVDLVRPLLDEHPDHPDVVPVAVEAQLGLGHPQEAMELVEPALEAHPEDVRLLAAKAHVQMALEEWEAALATLDRALSIEDDDADLHADRGRAARRLSRLEVAREAYDAALELSPSHPEALVGRLELDLLDFQPAQARRILERIDEAELATLEVERLRGRLLAMEIAGHDGLREVREALDEHPRDPSLLMSLGWLYMQAEQYSAAVRSFGRLVGSDDETVASVLARSLAQIRMRASNPARATLENLVEDLDESTVDEPVRAELHAVLGRLAFSDDNRVVAQREAEEALSIDEHNSEAHLVLADVAADRDRDATTELEAALVGRHPSSRALALLSIREEELTDPVCDYARRYRRAAPQGQYARGVWRVLRDCRDRDDE